MGISTMQLNNLFSGLKDDTLIKDQNLIAGEWQPSKTGQKADVTNPANDEVLGSIPESSLDDVQSAVRAATAALKTWRQRSGRERSRMLRAWFDLVVAAKDDLAVIISVENGKAYADAVGEAMMAAGFIEWFSEEAARIYGDVAPHSNPAFRIAIEKEPVGVCAMLTPWNFPAAMLTRKVAPCLAAGCTAIVKPDGQTPYTANALAVLAQRAGIPAGALNIVHALDQTPTIGKALCEHPSIRKLSFTGSTRVGKLLMAQSSSNLQKLSLELGGNAPFIVLDDADLDVAVTSLIASKFKVSGQTCVCANRVYVQDKIYNDFVSKLLPAVEALKCGPFADRSNTQGPLINVAGVEKSKSHVDDAVSKGAKILVGGKASPLGRNFFPPTLIVDATQSMKIASEETFGPVAALIKFSSDVEALEWANNAEVGLASYVMTTSNARARQFSEGLQAGMVAINTGIIADTAAPFGGIKHSGFGRESSKYGIDEYLQLKTVITGGVVVRL